MCVYGVDEGAGCSVDIRWLIYVVEYVNLKSALTVDDVWFAAWHWMILISVYIVDFLVWQNANENM